MNSYKFYFFTLICLLLVLPTPIWAGNVELIQNLNKVHQQALSRFIYQTDLEHFGQIEYWATESEIPDEGNVMGDCDDFAALIRKLLRKQRITSRLVYVLFKEEGKWQAHLVVEVNGWILDNRYNTVKRRDDLPYLWLSISGYEAGSPWHAIVNRQPCVTHCGPQVSASH